MIIVTKKTLSNVSLSKQKLIEACVQLVTINGRPFTLMEDSGFKMIIDPLLDAIGGGKHYFFFILILNKIYIICQAFLQLA